MADAVLVVQAQELPVYTYILVANSRSPVFADMLEATQNDARAATPQEDPRQNCTRRRQPASGVHSTEVSVLWELCSEPKQARNSIL